MYKSRIRSSKRRSMRSRKDHRDGGGKPFRGMETDNPYRHIKHFTTLCNTVRQEGVPDEWFKWNLFPYLLAKERHDIHLHLSKLGEIVIN
jgi:hypothetical protein